MGLYVSVWQIIIGSLLHNFVSLYVQTHVTNAPDSVLEDVLYVGQNTLCIMVYVTTSVLQVSLCQHQPVI